MILGGVEYVTGQEIQQRWPDVTPALLRDWCRATRWRPPLLRPLTVGQLAAYTGLAVPDGVDPDAPAQLPGAGGRPANLYPWREAVEAEHTMRRAARGARRAA